ncbi:MAG TPA: hypothetical protein VEY67_05870 [Candidatus Dormibacteraeota bacterium]|nr:hypothetical protein [Candidatus Dormibacteraeota bacterium]
MADQPLVPPLEPVPVMPAERPAPGAEVRVVGGGSPAPEPAATGGRPLGAPEPPAPDDVGGPTLRDPLAEAVRLIGLADAAGLQVRLLGGLSFHARCPEWTARIDRERRDIDLATRGRDRKALTALMEANGYSADRQYNALYGHKQLYFVDTLRGRPVDVLIDRMEMCHTFEFADRLTLEGPTLPLAELLLSKMQIAHINRKDILDALALLSEYPLADGDSGSINVRRITGLTSSDWGWWRTVTGNLDKFRLFHATEIQPGELDFRRPPRLDVGEQLAALRAAIDAAPKSTRWKLRAQVGERVQWYEEPEEVGHGR